MSNTMKKTIRLLLIFVLVFYLGINVTLSQDPPRFSTFGRSNNILRNQGFGTIDYFLVIDNVTGVEYECFHHDGYNTLSIDCDRIPTEE